MLFLPLLMAGALALTPPPRPNIVLVLTDDLDLLLGTLRYTPNINRLLRDGGITFGNAFVTNSVCCPSRTTLLRGQYTHSHRVYTNQPPVGGYQKFLALGHEESNLATWLTQAGYATALLGKYLNGYPAGDAAHVPPGWSDWHVAAGGNAYASLDYTLNENGQTRHLTEYMTDVLQARALDFIRAHTTQPFYLEIATFAPHQPATPAARHADLFPELSGNPLHRKRVQAMQAVDELVAALVRTLEQTGQLDNTYIFFTSDNGFHIGQHGLRAGKQTAYEEDIHVPLFVRGPGIAAGRTTGLLVANTDLAPTFAQLAGAAVPDFVEGRSLVPLFTADPVAWRNAVLIESYGGNGPDARVPRRRTRVNMNEQQPRYTAVRTARYTYVAYRNGKRQLFDLERDPHQDDDIAASSPPALLEALARWVRDLHACTGGACRAVEDRRN